MLPFFRRLSSTFATWVLVLLCLFSFSMMLWAARTDSAIDDELAHIPAGYGYVHNLDYRLNPEHPPLVKALAMLPVLFLNPTFPTNNTAWTTEVNGEWDMGRAFLYGTKNITTQNGGVIAQPINNANAIIQWARIMPILLTILTIIFVFLLARSLLGDLWALLPTALFALDPTVLANGHYVTTDVGAAFGVVFATYFFLRFLEDHMGILQKQRCPCSPPGLAFGVAQLTKFSTPFLVPLFLFVVFVIWLREIILRQPGFKSAVARGWEYLWPVLTIFAIGYVIVVYPVYALFTTNYPIAKQVSDTAAILTSFANGPTPAGQMCKGVRCFADFDIWAAHSHVLRPFAEYLLGILMVFQRSAGGNTIYFLGRVVNAGGWIYFPVLFLLKEPIPTLIIIFLALTLALWGVLNALRKMEQGKWKTAWHRSLDWIGLNTAEFTIASFIVLYWAFSMRSTLNLGIRYVLPTLPFIYILAAGIWKKWMAQWNIPFGANPLDIFSAAKKSFLRLALKYVLLVVLMIWLFAETAFAAPYFLSYFNEFGGGVSGGYHYVTDSNYDWGQDLLRLQTWVNAHPEVNKIAVDYFGGGSPKYYLDAGAGASAGREVDWSSAKGNPADPAPGSGQAPIHWLAISINQLEVDTQPLGPGETRAPQNSYAWLTALRPPKPGMGNVPTPDYRVGTTIFVYHLP